MDNQELLATLEERTLNILITVEKIEKHLDTQNDTIRICIEENGKNKTWRDTSKWLIGGLFTLLIVIFTNLAGLW